MVPPWNVRYRQKSGKHLLMAHYDPEPKWAGSKFAVQQASANTV
jgi:hypothetical protein